MRTRWLTSPASMPWLWLRRRFPNHLALDRIDLTWFSALTEDVSARWMMVLFATLSGKLDAADVLDSWFTRGGADARLVACVPSRDGVHHLRHLCPSRRTSTLIYLILVDCLKKIWCLENKNWCNTNLEEVKLTAMPLNDLVHERQCPQSSSNISAAFGHYMNVIAVKKSQTVADSTTTITAFTVASPSPSQSQIAPPVTTHPSYPTLKIPIISQQTVAVVNNIIVGEC